MASDFGFVRAGALVDDLIGGVVSDSVGRTYSGRMGRGGKAAKQNSNGTLIDM